jgi:hypothetical protein
VFEEQVKGIVEERQALLVTEAAAVQTIPALVDEPPGFGNGRPARPVPPWEPV